MSVRVRVLGPHWVKAKRLTIFANGEPVHEVEIAGTGVSEGNSV